MNLKIGIASVVLIAICSNFVTCQYPGESSTVPKKSLQNPSRRFKTQPSRYTGSPSPTSLYSNNRIRKPVSLHKSRTIDPIPEHSIYTSSIRGNRPYSTIPSLLLGETEDASAQPVHHSQAYHALPHALAHTLAEVKPVNEVHEKDEDVVQVISNIGNLPTSYSLSTASPVYTTTGLSPVYSSVHPQLEAIQYRPLVPQYQSSILPTRPPPLSTLQPEIHTQTQAAILRQQIQHQQQQHQQPPSLQPHHQPQRLIHKLQRTQHPKPSPTPAARNEFEEPSNEVRQVQAKARVPPKKANTYYEGSRPKKPVAQVIRRYREEMADGSIIWGYENDDGSFKEEIMGVDCITRGKYGYVDPDGVKREYTYETGIKCDAESQQQDQDILNTFVDYQENKLVLPSGRTIDLSNMGKKQSRRPPIRRKSDNQQLIK